VAPLAGGEAAEQERSRLGGLSALLDPVTTGTSRAIGVGPGWQCLEIGAGAGSIAEWLCSAVVTARGRRR
jgi:hypothetical protein